MKIVKLEAENIKRLKAVTIEPDGNLVVIGGDNEEGKSSTLDSIAYAMAGKSAICDEPVNRKAKKAKVVCDLGDLVVTRTFTKTGGGTLVVANAEGARYQSPQGMLDALVGKLSFDPLAFATMDPKMRLETLKNLVGLDFTDLDERRKTTFAERTAVNREVKELKARFDATESFPDAPKDEVSVAGLMTELEERQSHNRDNQHTRRNLEHLELNMPRFDEIHDEIAAKIAKLQSELKENAAAQARVCAELDERRKAVAALKDANEQETKDQISDAENINAKVRANAGRIKLQQRYKDKRAAADELTGLLETIDAEKAEKLGAAQFPVPDLSFDETGVTYQDIPFGQASDAGKLRVSVAMGIAMNPKLKVLLIRNGSLLDEKNLKLLAEMAAESDTQVWLERVGKGKECQVIIEDGAVRGAV